ncbi:MAG: TrmB family transcriptional regulator [Clostridiaceae bacterium]|nr:TrmB family transcriptional regulator [Clostridiaceae bacterium]
MNLIECLMKTGLTRHESELYVALCREGELTGYEAAKITGIARANTYQALAAMVDKGAVYVIEGAVPHYTAVPVDEYCRNIINNMQEIVNIIKRECPRTKKVSEPYITITGFKHIIDKIRNIIINTKERVYVSISEKELPFMKKELEEAIRRGLKVVAIISGEAELKGAVIHRIEKPSGQIRLIADSSYVLTGSITGSDSDTCLYSRNRPLVELIKDSLKNEIRLAELSQNTKGTHHID